MVQKTGAGQGQDVFRRALYCWLHEEPEETFLVPGGDDLEDRTWLLLEFMETAALRYIEKVKPYVHMDRGDVLRFLLHVQDVADRPLDITIQQGAILQELMKHSCLEDFISGFNLAEDFDDFLGHAPAYVQGGKDENFISWVTKHLGTKRPDHLTEDDRTTFLKLARKFGYSSVQDAVSKGSPWEGKSIREAVRFCEAYAAVERQRC